MTDIVNILRCSPDTLQHTVPVNYFPVIFSGIYVLLYNDNML